MNVKENHCVSHETILNLVAIMTKLTTVLIYIVDEINKPIIEQLNVIINFSFIPLKFLREIFYFHFLVYFI